MWSILGTVAPLFIIILVGVLARVAKIANSHWVEILNKVGLYVGFVPLIIYSLAHTRKETILNSQIIIINLAILAGVVLLTWLFTKLLRLKTELANTYILGIFFGNVAYLGLPFITSIYKEAAGLVSVHVAIYLVILLTLGVILMEGKAIMKKGWYQVFIKSLKNPLLLAVITGLFLLFFEIKIPVMIDEALRILAQSSSPVVLVALGIFLAQKIKFDADFGHALIISVLKLLVLPLVFVITWKFFGLAGNFNVSILEAGMPVAITVFAFAEIYPLRKQVVANSIIISTVLSAITLTALSFFISQI